MSDFISSDHHFHHFRIIELCKRPFTSLEEMHETLIERHNAVVRPNDNVFHLGDFSFREKHPDDAIRMLNRLNGKFHIVRGNHDEWLGSKSVNPKIVWVKDYHELRHNKQRFVLSHYPMLTWHGVHKGGCMLHGHCHGNVNQWNHNTRRLDVGVDSNDFRPWAIEDIAAKLNAVEVSPAEDQPAPMLLSKADTRAIINAIENPPHPTPAMLAAIEKRKELFGA